MKVEGEVCVNQAEARKARFVEGRAERKRSHKATSEHFVLRR